MCNLVSSAFLFLFPPLPLLEGKSAGNEVVICEFPATYEGNKPFITMSNEILIEV